MAKTFINSKDQSRYTRDEIPDCVVNVFVVIFLFILAVIGVLVYYFFG